MSIDWLSIASEQAQIVLSFAVADGLMLLDFSLNR